jgi:hypothetical protein
MCVCVCISLQDDSGLACVYPAPVLNLAISLRILDTFNGEYVRNQDPGVR